MDEELYQKMMYEKKPRLKGWAKRQKLTHYFDETIRHAGSPMNYQWSICGMTRYELDSKIVEPKEGKCCAACQRLLKKAIDTQMGTK
jgi:hypothetical protein